MSNSQISQWLTQKFLAWQTDQKEIKTLAEFADYLGVGRPALSMWISGKRRPGRKMAKIIAKKLGTETYDALEMARPEDEIKELIKSFDKLDPEKQAYLLERAKQLLYEQIEEERQLELEQKTVFRPKTT